MFPQSFALSTNPSWREFLEMMLDTDRATLGLMCVFTALVIYNVRTYLANPSLCTFISPMIVALSVAFYHLMILAEVTIPNNFNNWLVSTVVAISVGSAIGILIVAVLGQITEVMARLRGRHEMPEFRDPGANAGRQTAPDGSPSVSA